MTSETTRFPISPLIRLTLLLLYLALTLPLPFLAAWTQAPLPPWGLAAGLGVGAILLYGALGEQVQVNAAGIRVSYPGWISWLWRRNWSLDWSEIESLKPRRTGQGGMVYYCQTRSGQAYLLPMRMAGFGRFVALVQTHTGIDTSEVYPLAQPWMYLILLLVTFLLLLVDGWTLWTVSTLPNL